MRIHLHAFAVVAVVMVLSGAGPLQPRQAAATKLETSPLDQLLPYVGPEGVPTQMDAPSAVALYDEANEQQRTRSRVDQLLLMRDEKDLQKLDAWFETLRSSGEVTAAGFSKLKLAYDYFDGTLTAPRQDLRYLFGTVEKWQQLFPRSITPRIVKGMLMRNLAHYAFVNMPADKSADLESPRELVDRGLEELYADKEIAHQDPQWHALVMELEAERDASVAKILELLDVASRDFPKSMDVYKAAARAVAAVSQDPARDIEAVARLAVVRGGSDAYYTRVYNNITGHLGGAQAVRTLAIDWARMRKGIAEIVERYPVQWNIQGFAVMSCGGGDAATTRALIAKVRGRPVRELWGQLEYFDKCKRWATAASASPGSKTEKAVDQ